MAGFSELVADMDEIIADVLGDGEFGYLDRSGRQVGNAAVIVEEGVERMEAGALDRYRTIACRKTELQPLDRKGAFLDSDGQVWRIDGIHADDGDWITFYVVPE
ncbi:hypothetical protein ACIUV6_06110 [Pseudomonas aeruginosa]|uniref:hypothetical protein n=1 Tax=Pseudomonas aeruginosa TaxID=287 RepID=UPI001CD3FA73|nr:hypothetical protein [Pseudomonas aeruginosa]MDU0606442.1 hypothetical protein [Pseudomonas aeruginosa]UTL97936.1 hypothetical protein NLS69_05825 [Pseudomonas aeruginosa]HCH7696459.1 hypothetical protein [Pseudomonas aeruginosa]HCH7765309.1 hypothetical protein [Pseudomonas aeruginosa]HCI3514344.1 hypothetical protein [Pseudomonas aeruginosa]